MAVLARPGGHRKGARARPAGGERIGSTEELAGAHCTGTKDPDAGSRGQDEQGDRRGGLPFRQTVKNYVRSILAKLNLQRRAQAAAFVAKRQPGAAGPGLGSPLGGRVVEGAQQPARRSLGRYVEQSTVSRSSDRAARRGVPPRRWSTHQRGRRSCQRRRGRVAPASRRASSARPPPRRQET